MTLTLNLLNKCFIRHPIDKNSKSLTLGIDFSFLFPFPYELQLKNYSKELEVARLQSWYNHICNFRNNSNWLNKQFRTNKKFNFYKISRLLYNGSPYGEYYAFDVGPPHILLTDERNNEKHLFFEIDTNLDFIKIHEMSREDFVKKILERVPTGLVMISLLIQRDLQFDRPITKNDISDVWSLSLAIPYCDIVVTDKEMASFALKSKLDNKCGTKILNSIYDLEEFL